MCIYRLSILYITLPPALKTQPPYSFISKYIPALIYMLTIFGWIVNVRTQLIHNGWHLHLISHPPQHSTGLLIEAVPETPEGLLKPPTVGRPSKALRWAEASRTELGQSCGENIRWNPAASEAAESLTKCEGVWIWWPVSGQVGENAAFRYAGAPVPHGVTNGLL